MSRPVSPLTGLRIIDAVAGPLAPITRILAELGATVLRIAPDDGDIFEGRAANAGKVMAADQAADLAADRGEAVFAGADAIVENIGLDLAALRATRPALVTMTVSDFGSDTSLSGWAATGPVLHALSGELSRSGIAGQPPLLPPGDLAYQCAAVQAAWALLAACFQARGTGSGDHIDFSALDGAVQALDPGFGIGGSATLGRPAHLLSRDRPPRGYQYPIIACADGHVRICLLAVRQWQGMFRWLGEPPAFADPAFNKVGVRYKSPDLLPAIAAFFAGQTRDELTSAGEAHGVPIAALSKLSEVRDIAQFRERAVFSDAGLPAGPIRITPGEAPPPRAVGDFAGLKVLDLGIIVVGAEAGRLFADLGADVIKIESRAFPDGNRQSHLPYGLSAGFANGHRNKRSLGLDLRDPRGKALFLRLAAGADLILSNFKPGALAGLGLDFATLAAANPNIVAVESSAFGDTGPWRRRMGYGPLVRAATGLTDLWRYPDDPESFSDSITIYPDHVAGRVSAIAALALLMHGGGHAAIAQTEVLLAQFAADIARAAAGQVVVPDAPWGVFPAQGDDEWCVVTVRGDADWRRLCGIIGGDPALDREARSASRHEIDTLVTGWLAGRSAEAAMHSLQAAGVPAARMLRVADLPGFAYYAERGLFRAEAHPHIDEDITGEAWHARTSRPAPPARPAPLMGEHSAKVLAEWLGLDAAEIAELVTAGIVQPTEAAIYDAIAATRAARAAKAP